MGVLGQPVLFLTDSSPFSKKKRPYLLRVILPRDAGFHIIYVVPFFISTHLFKENSKNSLYFCNSKVFPPTMNHNLELSYRMVRIILAEYNAMCSFNLLKHFIYI